MKKLLIILLSALSLTAFAQQKKVAVYVTGEDAGINKVLGSKLVSAIARSEEYTAIERTESFLAELSKEQNYQRTGAVDDNELSRLGKQFGVQYICVAAVSKAFNEDYISARLIDVETAQVERTASSSGAIQSLDGIVNAAHSVSSDLLSSLGKGRQSNLKKVAVYVVKNEAGRNIGRVLGDKLVSGFTNSGRYIAIERTNSFLTQLNKEQNYQHSGAVDDNDLSRLGKQFGVQYVCVADVSDVFGEKYISARLIDVETAEVVNTHDVGGEMNSMSCCLRMANDIAANLSKGTFAEQAEEARLKAEEEARFQAEQERIRAEKEAKRKAEEARQQKILDDELNYVIECYNQGYVKIQTDLGEYLVDIKSPQSYIPFKDANTTHYKYGISGWRLPTKNEFPIIMKGLEDFCKLCQKHNKWINISKSTNKYWCVNWKVSWYYYAEWNKYANFWFVKQPDEHNDFTYAFQDWHVKTSVSANAIYIVKFSKETRDITSDEMTHDFERIKENGGSVSHVFRLPFSTDEIYSMKPTCACVTLKWTQDRSNPNVTLLTATYNPKGRSGEFTESITITLENGETTKKVLKGYVY